MINKKHLGDLLSYGPGITQRQGHGGGTAGGEAVTGRWKGTQCRSKASPPRPPPPSRTAHPPRPPAPRPAASPPRPRPAAARAVSRGKDHNDRQAFLLEKRCLSSHQMRQN